MIFKLDELVSNAIDGEYYTMHGRVMLPIDQLRKLRLISKETLEKYQQAVIKHELTLLKNKQEY